MKYTNFDEEIETNHSKPDYMVVIASLIIGIGVATVIFEMIGGADWVLRMVG